MTASTTTSRHAIPITVARTCFSPSALAVRAHLAPPAGFVWQRIGRNSPKETSRNYPHNGDPTRPRRRQSKQIWAHQTLVCAKFRGAVLNANTACKEPQARYNEIGVQQLSSHVYSQIFPPNPSPAPPELVELSRDHLRRHDLLGKNNDNTPPISFFEKRSLYHCGIPGIFCRAAGRGGSFFFFPFTILIS